MLQHQFIFYKVSKRKVFTKFYTTKNLKYIKQNRITIFNEKKLYILLKNKYWGDNL